MLIIFAGPVAKEWRLVSNTQDQPYCLHPSVLQFIPTPATYQDIVIL
jgi:hypothetical protein